MSDNVPSILQWFSVGFDWTLNAGVAWFCYEILR